MQLGEGSPRKQSRGGGGERQSRKAGIICQGQRVKTAPPVHTRDWESFSEPGVLSERGWSRGHRRGCPGSQRPNPEKGVDSMLKPMGMQWFLLMN